MHSQEEKPGKCNFGKVCKNTGFEMTLKQVEAKTKVWHNLTEEQMVSQQATHRLEIDALKSKHESKMSFLEEQIKEASSANSQLQWQQQALEKEIAVSNSKIQDLQREIHEETATIQEEL